ncbi:MAG TPA: AMP-binding protein [Terriglobales bacterium]|nr:AMP-binding protein [Terriglobales bacterium]
MNTRSQNVAEYLLDGKVASHIALATLEASYTYGDLRTAATDVAKYLLKWGARKGDHALLVSENGFFWVAAYLGILKAGLVCVPLPPTISKEDLNQILADTEAHIAFLQSTFAQKHRDKFGQSTLITDKSLPTTEGFRQTVDLKHLQASVRELPSDLPSWTTTSTDLAALMFTSGSTGVPHGVMISHGNTIANTESIIVYLKLTDTDRIMTVLPFHYCFGTSLLHTHLRVGGTLVLDHRFMYPEAVLQRMAETECTGFAGVPAHFQTLLRKSSLRRRSFPSLRYVQQAGGQLAPVFIRELRQALPGIEIFIMYGQTEATARLSYLPPQLLDAKLGSVGKGIPGVKLQVITEDGVQVQPGEVGEIVAEGENITLGYWREPMETAARYRNGRLYTGDLATIDGDGFIYIVDRARDFLKCGGERISCRQVENQMQEFECLLEAAVLGVPDETWGEAVKAFLVARMPGCPSFGDCFDRFCKEHLVPKLRPKEAVVLRSLPKNSSGKVLKRNL